MKSAFLLGAERVIAIDRYDYRLERARAWGAETINYEETDDLLDVLKELTGGQGPDACIDAVGQEAHEKGVVGAYDRVKQAARLESDRPHVLRHVAMACRKGGNLSIMGVYGGLIDKFPMGAVMNKALTLRTGQMHGQRYQDKLIEHVVNGDVDPSFVATHELDLEDAQKAFEMFRDKDDDCLRVVFRPGQSKAKGANGR
jgi:threonine dehydrogenase-like Zn-dependent dehydrogenase